MNALSNVSQRDVDSELMDVCETGSSRLMVDSPRDVMDNPRRDDSCSPGEPPMTPCDPSPEILGDGGRIVPS